MYRYVITYSENGLSSFKAQHFWMLTTSENVAHYMKLIHLKKKVTVQITQKIKQCSAWHGNKEKQGVRIVY